MLALCHHLEIQHTLWPGLYALQSHLYFFNQQHICRQPVHTIKHFFIQPLSCLVFLHHKVSAYHFTPETVHRQMMFWIIKLLGGEIYLAVSRYTFVNFIVHIHLISHFCVPRLKFLEPKWSQSLITF